MAIPPWGSPPSTDKVKKKGDVMTGDLDFNTHFLLFTDANGGRWKCNVTISGMMQCVPLSSAVYGTAIYGTDVYS